MTDQSGTGASDDPTQLREEVEQELRELSDEAAAEEAERMAARDRVGLDEPLDARGDETA